MATVVDFTLQFVAETQRERESLCKENIFTFSKLLYSSIIAAYLHKWWVIVFVSLLAN